MTIPEARKLLNHVVEKTARKELKWIATKDGNFRVDFDRSSIESRCNPDFAEARFELNVYNSAGMIVFSISPSLFPENEIADAIRKLEDIHLAAHDYAFEVSETIEDVMRNLGAAE